MTDTLDLAQQLIARPSVSPDDAGCQDILIKRLEALGFEITRLPFGDVSNFWAKRGNAEPVFTFAGHTDVVPVGDEKQWQTPPFTPTVRDGFLYGRGAADMKGGLAAMITATERFLQKHPNHKGSLSFLITSDEEDQCVDGTVKVVDYLQQQNEIITWCLVGEPSSHQQLGDMIKVGRRGSLIGHLKILGQQGHIAYPHLANNPIHNSLPAIQALLDHPWDSGNAFFPATSLQFSNIHSGLGSTNVIPGELNAMFNFRFSSATSADELQQQVQSILDKHAGDYQLEWDLKGQPFLTENSPLIDTCCDVIETVLSMRPELSTSGGTSDGRFIAPMGADVIEFGVTNQTIHQINECVAVEQLALLATSYELIL